MQLSKDFWLFEWQCRDGTHVPPRLVPTVQRHVHGQIQPLRDFLGRPLKVTCGYRSPEYNEELRRRAIAAGRKPGAAKESQHMLGTAVDIRARGMDVLELRDVVYRLIRDGKIMDGGVGWYPPTATRFGWVHIDIGRVGRRWKG